MSYILDALNKSENERRAGSIPGLVPGASYVVAPQKTSRHGGAAILIGAGMLVTGLALGNWRPWQSLPVVTTPEVAAPSPVAALPPATEPARLSTVPSKAVASPKPVALAAAKPVAPVKVVEVVAGAPRDNTAPTVPIVAQTKPQPTVPAASKTRQLAREQAPVRNVLADTNVQPQSEQVAAAPDRIVAYQDLPATVQGRVPKITFGGFAGVDESEVKIAFINNRLVKEGEEVSPGVKLEKVSSDGVVLAYQGHRFRP